MEEKTKTQGQLLMEKLAYKKKNCYEQADAAGIRRMFDYAEGYKVFLDRAKTEREAVAYAVEALEAKGFKPFVWGEALKAGDKRYLNNRGKSLAAFVIGTNDIAADGIRIVAAHIDAPRIDIKQNPLYEDSGMCFLKTHYYGGIKKYQWTAIPLALHGAVVLKDGSKVELRIGEEKDDPVFYINDLLPHLSREQMTQPVSKAIGGEDLNVVIGGLPYADKEASDRLKLSVLSILNEKYGITEEDFLSAELSAVPAFGARDIGLDRAFVGAYGHDDRVCSYPALTALLESRSAHTSMVILADKEEIGSEGTTGMQCKVFEDVMDEISLALGASPRQVRAASKCLSADVTAGYDPNFSSVFEKNNSSLVSYGASLCKFTGSGGKSGSSDASAEFVGEIRRIFADNGVVWQTSELGKVDAGGGGTVAKFLAKLNIDTVDIGVPVISMHAPYELISKADLYSTYQAFAAFFK